MQTFVLIMTNGQRFSIDQVGRQKTLDAAGMRAHVDVNINLTDAGFIPYEVFPNAVAVIARTQGR